MSKKQWESFGQDDMGSGPHFAEPYSIQQLDLRGIIITPPIPIRFPAPVMPPPPIPHQFEGPHDITPQDNNPEYMSQLRSFVHKGEVLEENGFVVHQLSESAIDRKKKCHRCGKAMQRGKKYDNGKRDKKEEERKDEGAKMRRRGDMETGEQEAAPNFMVPNQTAQGSTTSSALEPQAKPVFRCKFHDGEILRRHPWIWSCCAQQVPSDPCKSEENHAAYEYPEGYLERFWKFHYTPTLNMSSGIRAAVAIDCEMGTSKSGDSELIRVTLVDYFSSAILVDSLVFPDVEMQTYNTRYSGVSEWQIQKARRQGRCFMGKDRAREAVWTFVGPGTVVVGHAVGNDLNALRWIHPAVVDTMLTGVLPIKAGAKAAKQKVEEEAKAKAKAEEEIKSKAKAEGKLEEEAKPTEVKEGYSANSSKEAKPPDSQIPQSSDSTWKFQEGQQAKPKKPKGSGPHSLKTMTMTRLGRAIQTAGKKGHDSLEDALAARDLAHWLVVDKGRSVDSEEIGR